MNKLTKYIGAGVLSLASLFGTGIPQNSHSAETNPQTVKRTVEADTAVNQERIPLKVVSKRLGETKDYDPFREGNGREVFIEVKEEDFIRGKVMPGFFNDISSMYICTGKALNLKSDPTVNLCFREVASNNYKLARLNSDIDPGDVVSIDRKFFKDNYFRKITIGYSGINPSDVKNHGPARKIVFGLYLKALSYTTGLEKEVELSLGPTGYVDYEMLDKKINPGDVITFSRSEYGAALKAKKGKRLEITARGITNFGPIPDKRDKTEYPKDKSPEPDLTIVIDRNSGLKPAEINQGGPLEANILSTRYDEQHPRIDNDGVFSVIAETQDKYLVEVRTFGKEYELKRLRRVFTKGKTITIPKGYFPKDCKEGIKPSLF